MILLPTIIGIAGALCILWITKKYRVPYGGVLVDPWKYVTDDRCDDCCHDLFDGGCICHCWQIFGTYEQERKRK